MSSPLVRLIRIGAMLCVATASVSAQRASKPLDRANLDTTCAPCADFYQFANGTWLKHHTIPPDKSGLGSFGMLKMRRSTKQPRSSSSINSTALPSLTISHT